MSNKHSRKSALLLCVLTGVWLLVDTVVAQAASNPVPTESTNFELLGSVDTADDGTPANSRAYSKIGPWPFTEKTFLTAGCYEGGINPEMPGCFRLVDVKDPDNPKRIATVNVYDPVKSPLPPVPADPYWKTHPELNVWESDKFNDLKFSDSCGDWAVDENGKHTGPGWHDTRANPTCWDKGWITRTHYTAGASGDFQQADYSGKLVPGTNILWMTDEYFALPYGHLRLFDVSDLTKPKLLSHFLLPQTTDKTVTYTKRTGSTHLGNTWGKDLLFLAWYGLGVKAINISNPRLPYLVGTYSYEINDGQGGQATYDVIFDHEGNLAVTDSVDGVRVLKYTGPGSDRMHP